MKKFAIIGRLSLIAVIIGWTGCSDVSVSNDSAQNIEGAFGLKLGEVYEKEVDENYAAAFTPSNPVKPFTFYALVVVPSTKKICFITASAKFDDDDEAKRQEEVLKRVIEKKYNAKFQEGLSNSSIHEKYVQAIEKVKTREMAQRRLPPEQTVHENPALNLSPEAEAAARRQQAQPMPLPSPDRTTSSTENPRNDRLQELYRQRAEIRARLERARLSMNASNSRAAKKGGRVITMFNPSQRVITLSYGDENLMKSAIEEKKRKKEEKEESEINVEGL